MRFTDLVALVTVMGILAVFCAGGFKSIEKISSAKSEAKFRFESTRFVAESFKNTCEGKGFSSLIEWQKVCRAMWNLEYIAWCEASDFKVVSENEKGTLMYGKWIGADCEGEVYAYAKK